MHDSLYSASGRGWASDDLNQAASLRLVYTPPDFPESGPFLTPIQSQPGYSGQSLGKKNFSCCFSSFQINNIVRMLPQSLLCRIRIGPISR